MLIACLICGRLSPTTPCARCRKVNGGEPVSTDGADTRGDVPDGGATPPASTILKHLDMRPARWEAQEERDWEEQDYAGPAHAALWRIAKEW